MMMMIIAATNQPINRSSPAIVENDTGCKLFALLDTTLTQTNKQKQPSFLSKLQ